MFSTEDEYDGIIRKTWKYAVVDGITDIQTYKKQSRKILWILKEPNKTKVKKSYDWNHRKFHHEGVWYNRWAATYKKIMYVSFGIIHNSKEWIHISDIDENHLIDGINILDYIAIININKSGGRATANNKYISKCYDINHKTINKQIEEINPNIIINANHCDELFNHLTKGYKRITTESNLKYCKTRKRLIIDYYHPAVKNKGLSEDVYCNNIFKIVSNNYSV